MLRTDQQARGYLDNLHRFPSGYFIRQRHMEDLQTPKRLTDLGGRFPAETLRHIATCAKRCGSYSLFSSILQRVEQRTVQVLDDALEFLENGLNENGKERWKHLRAGLFDVQDCICQLADAAERQRLSARAIDLATGAIKFGRTKGKSERTTNTFAALPKETDIPQSFKSSQIHDIHQHSEARVQCFFIACAAVHNDDHEYCVGDTFCQSGKGEQAQGSQAAHSHILPSLNRRKIGQPWQRAKFDEVFQDTDFFKRLNVTVVLPKECNGVDSWVEGKRAQDRLRDKATFLLNRVASSNDQCDPIEACREFAGRLWDQLEAYCDRDDGDKLPRKAVDYAYLQKHIAMQYYQDKEVLLAFVRSFAEGELGAGKNDLIGTELFVALQNKILQSKILRL